MWVYVGVCGYIYIYIRRWTLKNNYIQVFPPFLSKTLENNRTVFIFKLIVNGEQLSLVIFQDDDDNLNFQLQEAKSQQKMFQIQLTSNNFPWSPPF